MTLTTIERVLLSIDICDNYDTGCVGCPYEKLGPGCRSERRKDVLKVKEAIQCLWPETTD